MIKFMMITNSPEVAKYATQVGVGRIFVDLEINGKVERQGHLNTVISRHSMTDVDRIRQAAPDAELMVRLNPLFEGTSDEVEEAISRGADLLMLPMFHYAQEVEEFCKIVAGRAGVIPLVETPQAAMRIHDVAKVEGVTEVYIGLNDLHLGLGIDFMFETLTNGFVEYLVSQIKAAGKPFGFGGVARVGEGLLPGEMVLGEHVRLGSASVILSRAFHGSSTSIEELQANIDLELELAKLRKMEALLASRTPEEVAAGQQEMNEIVLRIVQDKYRKSVLA